jgi:hypothetical protein
MCSQLQTVNSPRCRRNQPPPAPSPHCVPYELRPTQYFRPVAASTPQPPITTTWSVFFVLHTLGLSAQLMMPPLGTTIGRRVCKSETN